MSHEILMGLIGAVFAVLWYLLRQKDATQAAQIKDLYEKHGQDEKQLNELRIEIAKQHYVKGELDAKFDKLERAFREEMRALGDRIACSLGGAAKKDD